MNKKQRCVILIGCIIVAGMTLFPPYRGVECRWHSEQGDTLTRFIGYHFIYAPPSPEIVYEKLVGKPPRDNKERFERFEYTSHLDIERLATQIIAVVLITCGLAVVFQRRKTD